MKNTYSTIALAISSALFSQTLFAQTNEVTAIDDMSDIEVITVNGDFRSTNIQKVASAVSLLTQEEINRRQAQNLEEVLAIAPNVNFSAGSQRARYFQIRGIGERSQFQEPINPSVGVIIDGVDFTGIGSISSMFDVAQTEIFRGPQGTRFGANALAGMVNITTNSPADEFEGAVKATVGNYGAKGLGAVVSGPATDRVNYRIAAEKYESNGFIENTFLDSDDTNNRDELSLRAKVSIEATDDLTIDIAAMHFDFDNGYDAFSLDNTRETLSDNPGFDTQKTDALAATFNYQGFDGANITYIASYAKSDIGYGYDEDWHYGEYEWNWGPCVSGAVCLPGADEAYATIDHYYRERENLTSELRFTSTDSSKLFNNSTSWVIGSYVKVQDESLRREHWDWDVLWDYTTFTSEFETTSTAVYAQLDSQLSNELLLTTGFRVERRSSEYNNSTDADNSPAETMFGGKVALTYQLSDSTMAYASINRGYKAGGINTDGSIEDGLQEFDTETLWNYEIGYKTSFWDNTAFLRAAAFYMDRQDVQVKIAYQLAAEGDAPGEFIEYLDNASTGKNIGVEIESGWQVNDNVEVYASAGLLKTEYSDFSYNSEDGPVSLDGREQAHAPSYQFNLGSNVYITEQLVLNVSIEGKDEFYFSDSHEAKSESYNLMNASLTYSQENWNVSLWGRNITDKEYQTRGFYFGNDPRDDYTDKAYYQLGEPAVFGLTVNYNF